MVAKKRQYQPTGARVPAKVRRQIAKLHLDGYSFSHIARETGIDRRRVAGVCAAVERGADNNYGSAFAKARIVVDEPDPRARGELSPVALRALEDFGFFRARYFGRVSTPWQEAAAYRVRGFLTSPEKEFVVVNAPPSVGKSTLFTHDIPAWLACQDRRIRCLIGSRTFRQAKWYTGRLRRSFERAQVLPADEEEVRAGRALTPEASLVMDFGRFRPTGLFTTDVWRAEEFVIAQPGDVLVSEKEASFAAYGMDSGFLGGRFKLVIWDDLVDRKNIRSAESLNELVELYENEAETRLEPGGLLLLQGQRMAADDLYRHALDQLGGDPDDDDELRPKKYHHVLFKAHYPEVCRQKDSHGRDAPYMRPLEDGSPDPEGGCLLDPRRLPWRELSTIANNRMEKFRVLYQQEDVDPSAVLVPRIWIDGGTDKESGETFPGCWDKARGLADIPRGLSAPFRSIVSVDPSPTMFWAVQWWGFHPDSEQRFLLDMVRKKMDAPEFLDFNYANGVHTGLMEEWQARSEDLGAPISHWIVEANAAQRFLLQYDHVKTWLRKHRTAVVPHQTQRNKLDPEFGIQSIAPQYRFGRVRLPQGSQYHADTSRLASLALVDEVTRWPEGRYDDCVMAQWFFEFHLPRLFPRGKASTRRLPRPSWLAGESSRLVVRS